MRQLAFVFLFALAWSCKSIQPIQPPEFHYETLSRRFFATNLQGNFPLSIQRGANLYAASSENGFLFYTTNKDGSGDIWMRSLKNSINLPVIQHPAEQKMPAISADASLLVFVSEDRDSRGDLMLLKLQAKDIEKNALRGLPPVNLWKDSINLSKKIEKRAKKFLPKSCQGPAMESSPSLSADGKTLVFVSDRCNPKKPNLWMLQLDNTTIRSGPIRLTKKGGFQARLSKDATKVFFVSKRNRRPNGAIYMLRLKNKAFAKEGPVHIALAGESRDYLYAFPSISPNGRFLYYQSVREDSNKNGYLDLNDKGGIYKVALGFRPDGKIQSSPEKQILGAEHSIFSMDYSGFIGGSILYATRIYNNVNIYFINSDGIIPKRANIEEQYLITKKYRALRNERYILSLDAVFNFYGEQDEYDLYEAKILLDKYDFYKAAKNNKKAKKIQNEISYVRKNNSYADLEFRLREAPKEKKIQLLREYIAKLSRQNEGGSDKNMPLAQAAALFRLAKLEFAEQKYGKALQTIRRLNQNAFGFYLIQKSRLLEADIETHLTQRLSLLYASLLRDKTLPAAFADQIHKHIYERCIEISDPKERRLFISRALQSQDLPALIRATLLLARAQNLYEMGKPASALQILKKIVIKIPQEPYRKRTRPLRQWNGLTVRAWRLIAKIDKEIGDDAGAYLATLNYGGSICENSSATIDIQDFYNIIEESDSYIQAYLEAARKLASLIEERVEADLQKGLLASAMRTAKASFPAENQLQIAQIPISPEMDGLLANFCKEGSQNNHLFFSLGGTHLKDYRDFCIFYAQKKNRRHFPLEIAKQASSLLFTVSYANANILNILFFNMNQSSLFLELYREKAAYYHKLKIDIAREKLKIELQREQKKFFLPGQEEALQLLIEKDPFDSKIYDELEYGYLLSREENVEIGDTAMLFGHAYLLIARATDREGYYKKFQKNGGKLSAEFLREKKQKILQDLKNAEYILKYIINIDSSDANAYLLLGWLYEYLDQQQNSVLKIEPSYTEKLFNYLSGTRQDTLDKIEYADFYKTYFNFRFYEENIDLYRQLLDAKAQHNLSDKSLFALHLNLGNNYFKLLNFSQAIRHYNTVRRLIRQYGYLFENYKQKALFYANRGRAFFYAGQPAKAAHSFLLASQIYRKEELAPLIEKQIELRLQRKVPKASPWYQLQEIRKKQLQAKIQTSQKKIALLLSLRGLAEWDAGHPTEAILNYLDARKRFFANSDTNASTGKFQEAALLNFLALAQQQSQNYSKSNQSAKQASRLAKNQGLIHPEDAFQPKSLGGRLLGCILPFGEDFSVIGKGRNPYGFSPLRLYELALGIQFQNKILQGDLDGADYLMRQREQVFLTLEGNRKTGQIGYTSILSQQGAESYRQQDFQKAQSSFFKAAQTAFQANNLASFKLNFYNRFKVVFSEIEKKLNGFEEKEILREELQNIIQHLEETNSFKEKFRKKLIEKYIEDKKNENLDYEYQEELEKDTINRILKEELLELSEIQTLLRFYQGLILKNTANNPGDLGRGLELLRSTEKQFKQLIDTRIQQGIFADRKVLRWRLNRAQAALASGNFRLAKKEATRVMETAFEYNMIKEAFFSHFLLAQIPYESSKQSKGHLEKALQILKENPELFYDMEHRLAPFFRFATRQYLTRKKYQQALLVQEWAWEFKLSREYFRYPLHFQNETLDALYHKIRQGRLELRLLAGTEARLRLQRIDTKKIAHRKEKLKKEIKKLTREMRLKFPLHSPFLAFSLPREIGPRNLKKSQILLRFYRMEKQLGLWCMAPTKLGFLKTDIQNTSGKKLQIPAQKLFLQCIGKNSYHDIFIIEDDTMPLMPFSQWLPASLPPPVFLARASDLKAGFADHPDYLRKNLNYFNVNSQGRLSEDLRTDILHISLEKKLQSPLFSTGEYRSFDPRQWVQQERFSSLVLAKSEGGLLLTKKRKLYYEIFRLKGVATAIFLDSQADTKAILQARAQKRYSAPAVYGNSGFRFEPLRSQIEKKAQERMRIGKNYEKAGELDLARAQYRLAESCLHPPNQELPVSAHSNFENRLNLLRLDLKLDYNTPPQKLINPLLEETHGVHEKIRILKLAILTLVELGEKKLAQKYKKAYLSLQPKRKATIERLMEARNFVTQLETLNAAELPDNPQLLLQKFKGLLPVFSEHKKLLRLLWKHQFYDLAGLLLAYQKKKKAYTPALAKFEQAIRLERDLLQNPKGLPQDISQNISQDISLGSKPELQPFLKKLKREWRHYQKRLPVDIAALQNTIYAKDKSTYAGLNNTARSLLLELLLSGIPYDSNLIAMRSLEELIRTTARYVSSRRAAKMALLASESYLFLYDFKLSEYFYNIYKKYPRDFSEKAYISLALGYASNPASQKSGTTKSLEIYNKIPHSPEPEALKNYERAILGFLKKNPKEARQALLSIQLAKTRALAQKNWFFLLDLDFMLHRLRKRLVQPKFLFPKTTSLYPDIAQDLLRRLPEGQEFLAFLPFAEGSIRITWKKNRIHGARLPSADRRFLASLRSYIQEGYAGKNTSFLQSRIGQILGLSNASVRYIWLSGTTVFLPIHYKSKGHLFQILSPDALTQNRADSNTKDFPAGFSVQYHKNACVTNKDLDLRIEKMEEFVLRKNRQKNNSGSILHLATKLSCLLGAPPPIPSKAKRPPIAVLSRSDFSRNSQTALREWYKMITMPTISKSREGIFNIRPAGGVLPAEFTRQLYRPGLQAQSLEERFRLAISVLYKLSRARKLPQGSYRLYTNHIIQRKAAKTP